MTGARSRLVIVSVVVIVSVRAAPDALKRRQTPMDAVVALARTLPAEYRADGLLRSLPLVNPDDRRALAVEAFTAASEARASIPAVAAAPMDSWLWKDTEAVRHFNRVSLQTRAVDALRQQDPIEARDYFLRIEVDPGRLDCSGGRIPIFEEYYQLAAVLTRSFSDAEGEAGDDTLFAQRVASHANSSSNLLGLVSFAAALSDRRPDGPFPVTLARLAQILSTADAVDAAAIANSRHLVPAMARLMKLPTARAWLSAPLREYVLRVGRQTTCTPAEAEWPSASQLHSINAVLCGTDSPCTLAVARRDFSGRRPGTNSRQRYNFWRSPEGATAHAATLRVLPRGPVDRSRERSEEWQMAAATVLEQIRDWRKSSGPPALVPMEKLTLLRRLLDGTLNSPMKLRVLTLYIDVLGDLNPRSDWPPVWLHYARLLLQYKDPEVRAVVANLCETNAPLKLYDRLNALQEK